jgi:hypothetical protein
MNLVQRSLAAGAFGTNHESGARTDRDQSLMDRKLGGAAGAAPGTAGWWGTNRDEFLNHGVTTDRRSPHAGF